jgi:hypothetical protein
MTDNRKTSTPLVVKAANLMGAGLEAARRAITPGVSVFVDDKTREERLNICHKCPLLIRGECDACGCIVSEKVKFAGEFCEEGNWSAVRGRPDKGLVRGSDIMQAEVELRMIIPTGRLAETFNAYHQRMQSKMRCKPCEVRGFARRVEIALGLDFALLSPDEQEQVREALPNKENVMFTSLRKWEDVMKPTGLVKDE